MNDSHSQNQLSAGTVLSHYQIVEKIGAGGMGDIYRASDTRLDRTVAIKVLPPGVANNGDLRARFDREAKAISSLNHPNICTLFDVGHQNGLDFLVMEYIEGKTLTDRLGDGPLESGMLLSVAIQIADALDKAHGQGLIHRDLKPGNIMLTKEGAKLLDFGLAKLQQIDDSTRAMTEVTSTTPLTGEGTILGTLQYMAPEQLEGREVDARSDIFSFGAVLYEMATGEKAFSGRGRASLIASIMKETPRPISQIQPLAPLMLEQVTTQCLEKNPDHRWQSAGELKQSLQRITDSGSQVGISIPVAHARKPKSLFALGLAAVATLAALFFAGMWLMQPAEENSVLRFSIETDPSLSSVSWPRISPDGKSLAFIASGDDGVRRIYIRPMNSLDAYPLAGTDNAGRPFWSPDSRYLGFIVSRGQLKKIAIGGGPAQLIGETGQGADGSWGRDGIILYDGGPGDSIRQIAATGGISSAATKINRTEGESGHAWPWFLPDGRHFLYLASLSTATNSQDNNVLMIGSLDGDEPITLFPAESRAEYCEPGFLLYVRGGILLAHPFDPDKLETSGEPFPLADRIGMENVELAHFGASDQGTLAIQHDVTTDNNHLIWFDRTGDEIGRVGEGGAYENFSISPDGLKLAYAVQDDESDGSDIWVWDLNRDVPSRLTFDPGNEIWPLWSVDGKYIYYASDSVGRFQLRRKAASGLGQAEEITMTDVGHIGPCDFSPDGTVLYTGYIDTHWDIITHEVGAGLKEITTLISTKFNENMPRISPDGKFMAYTSNETGRYEVYVQELSETGGKWQISSTGARHPAWRADGSELFFITTDWDLMAVPVSLEGTFEAGRPELLFNRKINTTGFGIRRYAVSPDGQKFLYNTPVLQAGGAQFVVTTNRFSEFEH